MHNLARNLAAAAAAVALQVGCVTVTLASTAAISTHLSLADCRAEAAAALLSGAHCHSRAN